MRGYILLSRFKYNKKRGELQAMIADTRIQQAKTVDILSLIPTEIKRVSTNNGGEYAGPCPICGGTDRFRVWPATGRYWCRQCGRKGDVIDLVMETKQIPFEEAVQQLTGSSLPVIDRQTHTQTDNPWYLWQDRARAFLEYAQKKLKPDGIDYLATRGIDQLTAWGAGLGWNPEPITDRAARWGVDSCVYLGAGLVIPYEVNNRIVAINIRTANGYRIVKGSKLTRSGHRIIYAPVPWPVKGKVILFEGEFDALSAWQALSDPEIAIGSIPAGNLTQLPEGEVYVCFDNDQAGHDATSAAAEMGAKVIKVPEPHKDFNEFFTAVGDSQARAFLYREITI